MNYSGDSSQHIAVIGMTCRFPQAKNIEEFWYNVEHGIESITFFSDQEALSSGVDPKLIHNPNYVKAYGVLEDIEMFDASFFGLSPREATWMDPQQRLFLECAWEALESAGYDPSRYKGRIGVYASTSSSSYLKSMHIDNTDLNPLSEFQIMLGSNDNFLATSVSYKLNLRGPSMVVKTACSSSLVAMHLAIQSLLNFESDIVLAGGVSINIPQKYGYLYQEGNILSPDGHCRAFDAKAKGTVSGSGLGIVLLKRLTEALEDGDIIHAIIRGSAVNNDGSAKVGYTAPSIDGQAKVIAEALDVADVHPETVSYIETHGTGTLLGDPIEIAAISRAFRDQTEKKCFCAIGSVKTNIGHLDAVAGIAGLIKTILALKHKILPPSLHFEQPNPNIAFVDSPFFVNTQAVPWQPAECPRRAGVSSFGIGGTNAHILLEEAPVRIKSQLSQTQSILMLSAKTEAALETMTDNLAACLRVSSHLPLADTAYTLQVGRQAFDHRRVLVCANPDEAATLLTNRDIQRLSTCLCNTKNPSVVFMFPGVGTQYPDMGRGLYQTEATFREEIDRCLEFLQSLGVDLRSSLYPDYTYSEVAKQQLRRSSLTLPSIFITEYALAKLWISWGVLPQAMIGHSFGEYVSACLSGVMSLEDALSVIVFRGQLVEQLPKGAMIIVPLPVSELEPLLNKELSLAAVNGPALCVVSGPVDAINTFEKTLQSKALETRRIHLDTAYHSSMLTPILAEFKAFIKRLSLHLPTIPYISNVTGTWITAADATNPDYWVRHLRQTVRFAAGIQELLLEPSRVFLEVGPGHVLSSLVKLQMDSKQKQRVFPSLYYPQDSTQDSTFLLHTLSNLWLQGLTIDWHGFYAHERRQRVALPTYPFERQRYWLDLHEQANKVNTHQPTEAKASNVLDCLYTSSWKQCLPLLLLNRNRVNSESYWLAFTGTTNIERQIIMQIDQWGQKVTVVAQGQQFSKHTGESYTVNLQEHSDYGTLFDELIAQNKRLPDKILYLRSIASFSLQSAMQDFSNLLVLFQVLEMQRRSHLIEIIVVSNKSLVLTDEDFLYSEEQAPPVGLYNSFPLLSSNIVCRMIDVIPPQEGSWQERRLINKLLADISLEATDQVVAYRGDRRWAQTTESLSLLSVITQRGIPRLRPQGTYLILGGFEDIGFQFAHYIAQNVHATFILIEDAVFPASDQWDEWLTTHDREDTISRKIHNIRVLKKVCTEVRVFSINTHEHHLQTELLRTFKQCGEIHGVFYQDKLITGKQCRLSEIKLQDLLQHLQSKMSQLAALEHALENISFDFCCLSSLPLMTGEATQVINITMSKQIEAFIHRHNHTNPIAWLGIHWDASCFEKEWQDLLSSDIVPTELVITQQALSEIFQQLLSIEGVPFITVSTRTPYTQQGSKLDSIALPSSANIQTNQISKQDSPPSTTLLVPSSEIEVAIANIWKELLGLEEISINDNFFLLGGHSLLAAQLNARLREAFMFEVPLQSIFDNPTIAGLASTIDELFLEMVVKLSDEEAQQLLDNQFSSEL